MDSNSMLSIDNFIDIKDTNSWIHRWETRTKMISCTISVFGLVALKTPNLLIASYLILLICLLTMGISIKDILKRTSYILPFIFFMSLPLLVGGGMPPSSERQTLVLLLAFKALNSLYIMFMIFYSQPTTELLNGLSYMKLPSFFISILFLSWRYIFLLGDKLANLYKALLSRLFRPSIRHNSLKTYGQVMGGMLIKSIDTSDKVHRAMSARGFNGTMPTSRPRKIKSPDLVKSTIMVSSVIVLNLLEKWWY